MNDESPSQSPFAMIVAFEGGIGLVAWLIGWLLGQSPWQHVHWEPTAVLWGTAAAALPLAFLFFSMRYPIGPLEDLKRLVSRLVRELFAGSSLVQLAIVSLMAGFGEELLFRGVIQYFAAERFGDAAGLVVASVLFGLVHPMSKTYVVLAGLIGLYLGWLWIELDNLLVPIVTHAVYDFVALVYLVRGPSAKKTGGPTR